MILQNMKEEIADKKRVKNVVNWAGVCLERKNLGVLNKSVCLKNEGF
jgi:hypothetical protein